MSDQQSTGEERVRRLYEDAEKQTADAMEKVVRGNAFGELLARSTENVMGLTKIGFDTFDLVVRNLRIAGRKDVVQLNRQLARTEDKLERVLQEVEGLRDELKRERSTAGNGRSRSRGSNGSSGSRRKASSSSTKT